MKSHIQNLTMLSAVIAFASCNSNKSETPVATENQMETVVSENDSVAKETPKSTADIKTIEGIVKEINFGKDGYTATIETNNQQVYKAVISRANLTDSKQFRDFNNSEIVKLKGDFWKMEGENQLTVREIQ
jgi:hypothetical protein